MPLELAGKVIAESIEEDGICHIIFTDDTVLTLTSDFDRSINLQLIPLARFNSKREHDSRCNAIMQRLWDQENSWRKRGVPETELISVEYGGFRAAKDSDPWPEMKADIEILKEWRKNNGFE